MGGDRDVEVALVDDRETVANPGRAKQRRGANLTPPFSGTLERGAENDPRLLVERSLAGHITSLCVYTSYIVARAA